MAVGDLVTRPGHVQYGELLLGPGTPYRWRDITGWEDLPPLDSGTVPRSDAHGAFPGLLLAQARTIGFDGLIVRAPRDRIGAVVGALNRGTAPVVDELPFVAWLDDRGPLLAYARATRRAVPVGKGYRLGTITGGALEFEATDARRYEIVERSTSTMLPVPEPGLDWGLSTAPVQRFPPTLATGQAPASQWSVVAGCTLAAVGGAVEVTVTAAAAGAPAEVAWTRPEGYGWPVLPGEVVGFRLDFPPPGAGAALLWLDGAGAVLSKTTGTDTVTAAAPAGAVEVLPVTYWTAVPTPATQRLGGGRMWVPAPAGEGLLWPLDFGAPGSAGAMAAANVGDAPTHPVVEFRGPVVRPALTNVGTGDVLEYDLPLAADDVLAVDTRAGTVTLNGTASRLHTATARSVPEQTFTLPPGTADLMFRAAPGSTDPRASATVRYRSAYW